MKCEKLEIKGNFIMNTLKRVDVLMEDGSTGFIYISSIDYQDVENFIGERIRFEFFDENGILSEREGVLKEVFK
jgi:hypothetical protein